MRASPTRKLYNEAKASLRYNYMFNQKKSKERRHFLSGLDVGNSVQEKR